MRVAQPWLFLQYVCRLDGIRRQVLPAPRPPFASVIIRSLNFSLTSGSPPIGLEAFAAVESASSSAGILFQSGTPFFLSRWGEGNFRPASESAPPHERCANLAATKPYIADGILSGGGINALHKPSFHHGKLLSPHGLFNRHIQRLAPPNESGPRCNR